MKIEVNGFEWCPDNCRCFSAEREMVFGDNDMVTRVYTCANSGICANTVLNYQRYVDKLNHDTSEPCTK